LLLNHSIMSESEKMQIYKSVEKEVEEATAFARESPYPNQSELLSNVFKT